MAAKKSFFIFLFWWLSNGIELRFYNWIDKNVLTLSDELAGAVEVGLHSGNVTEIERIVNQKYYIKSINCINQDETIKIDISEVQEHWDSATYMDLYLMEKDQHQFLEQLSQYTVTYYLDTKTIMTTSYLYNDGEFDAEVLPFLHGWKKPEYIPIFRRFAGKDRIIQNELDMSYSVAPNIGFPIDSGFTLILTIHSMTAPTMDDVPPTPPYFRISLRPDINPAHDYAFYHLQTNMTNWMRLFWHTEIEIKLQDRILTIGTEEGVEDRYYFEDDFEYDTFYIVIELIDMRYNPFIAVEIDSIDDINKLDFYKKDADTSNIVKWNHADDDNTRFFINSLELICKVGNNIEFQDTTALLE